MNIAYCMSGHLRTGRKNLSLLENLITPYPGDVFIHTFRTHDAPTSDQLWHNDRMGADEPLTDDDLDWIHKMYAPKALQIDLKLSPREYMPEGCGNMAGRRSLYCSNELRRQRTMHQDGGLASKYDVVFCVRFDLMFDEKFVFSEMEEDTIYTGMNLNSIEQGLDADVWWFGSESAQDKMTGVMIPEDEIAKIPSYGHKGEELFTSIRKKAGLKCEPFKMRYDLLRSWGPLGVRNGVI
jgi:hypothetical protein